MLLYVYSIRLVQMQSRWSCVSMFTDDDMAMYLNL
jgi:hypothetical protein